MNNHFHSFVNVVIIKYIGKFIAMGKTRKQSEQLTASKIIQYVNYKIFY